MIFVVKLHNLDSSRNKVLLVAFSMNIFLFMFFIGWKLNKIFKFEASIFPLKPKFFQVDHVVVKFKFFLLFCGCVVKCIFYWWYLRSIFLFKRNYFFKCFLIANSNIKVGFFFSFICFCIRLLITSCLSVSVTATRSESTPWLRERPVIAQFFDFLNRTSLTSFFQLNWQWKCFHQ